jgi:hypothetical protein
METTALRHVHTIPWRILQANYDTEGFFPGLGNGADRAKEAEKKELGLIRDVLSLQ